MGQPAPLRNPAGYAGLVETVRALIASLTLFLESRLKLAARESKAAVRHLLVAVVCLVVALVLSILGYVFLIVFVIVGLAMWIGVSWIWVALGAAVLHFIIALICLVIARAQLKRPLLRDTVNVLKEDAAWLKNQDHTKRP